MKRNLKLERTIRYRTGYSVICYRPDSQENKRLLALIPIARENTRQLNKSDAFITGEIGEVRLNSMHQHSPFVSIEAILEGNEK